jgi:hypothetical protein
MLATGINKLQVTQAAVVVVAQTQVLTGVDFEYLAA